MTTLRIVEDSQVLRITGVAQAFVPNPFTPSGGAWTLNGDLILNGLLIGGSSPFRIESRQTTLTGAAFQLAAQLNITGKLVEVINDGDATAPVVWSIDGLGITYLGTLTTAQEPAASVAGRLYWNTDLNALRVDNGTSWATVGGAGITDPITVNGWTPIGGTATITGIISGTSFTDTAGIAAPALSGAGTARMYFDSTANQLLVSENGGAYAPVITAGIAEPITVHGWTPAGGTATITGNISGTAFTDTAGIAAPALSGAGTSRMYFDSTANQLLVSENGGAYAPVITAGIADPITVNGWTPAGGTATITGIVANGSGTFDLLTAETDSASAVGFTFNTPAYTTVGAKLASFENNSVEEVFLDKDGVVQWTSGTATVSIGGSGNAILYKAGSGHFFQTHTGAGGAVSATNAFFDFFRADIIGNKIRLLANTPLGALDADVEFADFVSDNGAFNTTKAKPVILTGTHLMLNKHDDITVDAQLEDSRILRFRAAYDSDPTGGFTAANFDGNVQHIMLTGGATPTSKLSFTFAGAEKLFIDSAGGIQIGGDLDHNGNNIGFYGTAPAAQSAAYTRNATIVEDRTLLASASATTINNNNVLAALIADLQATGIIG